MPAVKHEATGRELLPRRRDLFERFFDDRLNMFRWPLLLWPEGAEGLRVEEFREDDNLVVRAELAGVDPDKDIEISMSDNLLRIEAERHQEEKREGRNYVRREFRYGSFVREFSLPAGVTESDIKATYKDGILEVRVPMHEYKDAVKVQVTKS